MPVMTCSLDSTPDVSALAETYSAAPIDACALGMQFGRGQSFSSFGEIVQGRLSGGEDFLVTLPVDLWSTCILNCVPTSGESVIESPLEKSAQVAKLLLQALGMTHGLRVQLDFDTNIPTGKGLSSSTADMLAVVRAFQDTLGVTFSEQYISNIFTKIEPHDGLHYDGCVAYNHRQGKLLKRLNYIPSFRIVGVDSGGECSTAEYNRRLVFTSAILKEYDQLYRDTLNAFKARDDHAIAQCAYRSSRLHAQRTGNALLNQLLARVDGLNALGILATHSGTCGGILLPSQSSEETVQSVEKAVGALGRVFHTRTLQMGS